MGQGGTPEQVACNSHQPLAPLEDPQNGSYGHESVSQPVRSVDQLWNSGYGMREKLKSNLKTMMLPHLESINADELIECEDEFRRQGIDMSLPPADVYPLVVSSIDPEHTIFDPETNFTQLMPHIRIPQQNHTNPSQYPQLVGHQYTTANSASQQIRGWNWSRYISKIL
ncbi:hypothetical protein ABW19_dt0208087 [Dactylella cylindrospora]|nr:hypothetical protein ABW19_dt0208087 [Dactylella cylindrospora]